jgi:hypothetical protein
VKEITVQNKADLLEGANRWSAVWQHRRRADHTNRQEGDSPHGPDGRSVIMTDWRAKSKIASHDLLHRYRDSKTTI